MTVKELKEMLSKCPDEMEILNGRYSDYEVISIGEWSIVDAVPMSGGWVMRAHVTMSEENKRKCKSYLYLEGN